MKMLLLSTNIGRVIKNTPYLLRIYNQVLSNAEEKKYKVEMLHDREYA